MRYAGLAGDYILRGFQDLPYVLIDKKSGRAEAIDKNSFWLLNLCNGKIDLDMVPLNEGQRAKLDKLQKNKKLVFSEKPFRIHPEQEYRKADNFYLRSIHWSITGRCNLKCRHCYMSAPDYKYKDLPTETCLGIIEQMGQANVASVSITGGEPFVREDIWELFECLQRKGITVTQIYTNGLLLTEEILRRLKEMEWLPEFVVSFDGAGAHDWLRGKKGACQRAIGAMRMLKQHGFPVMVETAIFEKNIGTLTDTYSLLKELSIDYWKTSLIFQAGSWRRQQARTIETEELYQAYLKLIDKYIAEESPFSLQLDGFFACRGKDVTSWFSPYVKKESLNMEEELCCATCRVHPYLLPDGTFLPCATMTDSGLEGEMPNLQRETISQIYREPAHPFFRTANMRTAEVFEKDEECRICRHRARCRGGCRAMSLVEGRGLYGHARVLCTFFNGGYEMKIKRTVEKAGKERKNE